MWTAIYNDLLDSERIWDIFDVIVSMINIYDPQRVLIDLFNDPFDNEAPEGDQDPLRRLLEDLASDKYDESTELAITSILVELTYAIESSYLPENEHTITAKRCLQQASVHARLIAEHSPELTKSRPYLIFLLAKERFHRYWNGEHSYMRERQRPAVYATGMTCALGGIPRYIPTEAENPGWPPPDPKFPPNRTLQDILLSARELGDYELEAASLTELICRVEDPIPLLDQLEKLQKTTQGHHKGYIQTCLSRYLLVKDQTSAQKLLGDLEQSTHRLCALPENDAFPPFRWNELKVRNALHITLSGHVREASQTMNLANALFDDHRTSQRLLYTTYLQPEDRMSSHQVVFEPSRSGTQDGLTRKISRQDALPTWPELRTPRTRYDTKLQQDDRIPKLEQAVWEIKRELERLHPGEHCTDLVVRNSQEAGKDNHGRGLSHVMDSNTVGAKDQAARTKQALTRTGAQHEQALSLPQDIVGRSGDAGVNIEVDETRSDHSLDH